MKLLIAFALLLFGLIVLTLGLLAGALLLNRLPWHDPPGVAERLGTYLGSNVAETRPDHRFPELRMRVYLVPKDVLYKNINNAIRQLGWRIESTDPSQGELHAVVSTPLFHFKDDVWVRAEPRSEGQTSLYVRAASRVGRGDLGANTRHILDLQQALGRELGDAS